MEKRGCAALLSTRGRVTEGSQKAEKIRGIRAHRARWLRGMPRAESPIQNDSVTPSDYN
ncbi:hypothetical protein OCAR_5442 [Afipia carboxidovorans OM5]|nr:hypothetical protein OCAR_5442 [Afipia carboxidovorans OM5]